MELRDDNSTLGYIIKETQNTNLKECMYSYTYSIIYNSQGMEQPKCLSIDEWIKKWWFIYKMQYYSAVKRMKSYYLQQHGWI